MKATADTLAHLALCRDEQIQTHTPAVIKTHRQSVNYAKSQFIAFIWSMYHHLAQADKQAIRDNQGTPLQDQHIETALKDTWKEYL